MALNGIGRLDIHVRKIADVSAVDLSEFSDRRGTYRARPDSEGDVGGRRTHFEAKFVSEFPSVVVIDPCGADSGIGGNVAHHQSGLGADISPDTAPPCPPDELVMGPEPSPVFR